MSIISGIYKITLKDDGRFYIGSAADIYLRWRWHRNSQTQLIGKMIKKYGKGAFLFEVVEKVEPIKELLEEREQYYLDTLKPFPWNNNRGFNLCEKAYTVLGVKRSEETKEKMRNSWHKNRGPEYLKQCSERVKGDKNPACRIEVREKISKAMIGKTWKDDTERIERHRAARLGKKYNEQARANMKLAQQNNRTRSAEAKEKFYLAQRRLYQITRPDGSNFEIYSRELKLFCKDNGFSYANLIGTSKTGKSYKGGWSARLI